MRDIEPYFPRSRRSDAIEPSKVAAALFDSADRMVVLSGLKLWVLAALAVALLAGMAGAASGQVVRCVGDCNGDGEVAIDEVVRGIFIALDRLPADMCRGMDRDHDGMVTVDELVAAVVEAPDGCVPPTPLPTATPVVAEWRFTDVTAAAGIDYEHGYAEPSHFSESRLTAGGVAAGDYDRDGWIDLYAVRGDAGTNLLLRNRGDGMFDDVAAAAGVALAGQRGTGAVFADIDGDGWLDLLVLAIDGSPPRLFRNRAGTFEDISQRSGLTLLQDSYSAAFADYDRDGDLDLFVTHWGTPVRPGESSRSLWRNDGDGSFTDVSLASGVTVAVARPVASDLSFDFTFTPNFADIDHDGWPDLLVAADFGASRVLINARDGTFIDRTDAVISDENGMGGTVGDFDGDGNLDWFVSSIFDPNGVSEGFWGTTGNRLYRNRGDGTFDDATDSAGVRDGGWGWGTTFADLDNDGWLDLFMVNGWRVPDGPLAGEFESDPARLFVNSRDGTFLEQAAALGADDRGQGRGVVAFDYDNDGDLDLFIANNEGRARLLRNDGGNQAGNFLDIELRATTPNPYAIGTRIYVTATGRTQMREIRAGSNFQSQDPTRQHFGLGPATAADEVRIVWPDGTIATSANVPANQVLWISPELPQRRGSIPRSNASLQRRSVPSGDTCPIRGSPMRGRCGIR